MTKPLCFSDLPTGSVFRFADTQHPLGWPDGLWKKTGEVEVVHLQNGVIGDVLDVARPVEVVWTAETVREQLPPVEVLFKSEVYPGYLRERSDEEAAVFWSNQSARAKWETIARRLNEGKPVRA